MNLFLIILNYRNINSSKDINKSLERLFLIENEDYLQSEPSRGKKYAKEYKLTPYAFKL